MPDDRSSAHYRATRRYFQTAGLPCWICGAAPGTSVDHVPALADFPPGQWHGQYRPACPPCNSRGGAAITNRIARTRWVW